MIYDSNHPTVSLSKEIDYMNNYVSLERLRLNDEVDIHFDVKGPVEKMKIVPLILITFLENAFEHGLGNQQGAYVKASLFVEGNSCTYRVENSHVPSTSEKTEKSGIGLMNVKRRLALSYPEKYDLHIEDSENKNFVELKLTLA
jgi:LytS/YehU family sensor histidine kinase